MSLVNAIRLGLGFLDILLGLLVAEHHYQSIALKKMVQDLNRAAAELDDISDQVSRISATMEDYYG